MRLNQTSDPPDNVLRLGRFDMRNSLLLFLTMLLTAVGTFAADCSSAIQITQRTQNGKAEFTAKNTSERAIVAYIITANAPDTNGNSSTVFSGVFTDGDTLRPGASMEIGTSSSRTIVKPVVDYVRLADGWACGQASTKQAKEAIARFQGR